MERILPATLNFQFDSKTHTMDPTPMRPEYKIEDQDMADLTRDIFIIVDQAWDDATAFDLSERIDALIEMKIRSHREKLLQKLSDATAYEYDDIFEEVEIP